jgi:hypothetical protein
MAKWRNGSRNGLKIRWRFLRAGSSPALATNKFKHMKLTIKKLRQTGFKVRVIHARLFEKNLNIPSGKGGTTTIEITTPDKQFNAEGFSKCSKEDSYNRKLGNSIALGRAVQNLIEINPSVESLLKTL